MLPKFRASGQPESKTDPFRPHQTKVPVLSQFHLAFANMPGEHALTRSVSAPRDNLTSSDA
jgi:hypothetical protein